MALPLSSTVWFSVVPSSGPAVCLAADADTEPSVGAAPAGMLSTPTGERRQAQQHITHRDLDL